MGTNRLAKLCAVGLCALTIVIVFARTGRTQAQENPLPLLPGLENAVEFWKQIFTRYGSSDVIFHDRQEPLKIYQILAIDENAAARKIIKTEIERIAAEQGEIGRAHV